MKAFKTLRAKLPAFNNQGHKYASWHAKNPKNAIAVPQLAAPTKRKR